MTLPSPGFEQESQSLAVNCVLGVALDSLLASLPLVVFAPLGEVESLREVLMAHSEIALKTTLLLFFELLQVLDTLFLVINAKGHFANFIALARRVLFVVRLVLNHVETTSILVLIAQLFVELSEKAVVNFVERLHGAASGSFDDVNYRTNLGNSG